MATVNSWTDNHSYSSYLISLSSFSNCFSQANYDHVNVTIVSGMRAQYFSILKKVDRVCEVEESDIFTSLLGKYVDYSKA